MLWKTRTLFSTACREKRRLCFEKPRRFTNWGVSKKPKRFWAIWSAFTLAVKLHLIGWSESVVVCRRKLAFTTSPTCWRRTCSLWNRIEPAISDRWKFVLAILSPVVAAFFSKNPSMPVNSFCARKLFQCLFWAYLMMIVMITAFLVRDSTSLVMIFIRTVSFSSTEIHPFSPPSKACTRATTARKRYLRWMNKLSWMGRLAVEVVHVILANQIRFMIHAIIDLNCYKFCQSRDFHRRLARAEPDLLDQHKSAGIWINASYINHSCLPNIEAAFIGDMIIIRAAKDLAAGSELTYSYTGLLGAYDERQSGLRYYGFQCTCYRCLRDINIHQDCRDVRVGILNSLELENRKLAMSKAGTTLGRIEKLLDDFDNTYTTPPSDLPRPEIYMELFISIRNFDSWEMFAEVVTLGCRLLVVSGFDLRIGREGFRVMQWGSVSDLTVASLAYMWKAYGTVNPVLCHGVEEILKTAYEIVVGEKWSFESVYGELRAIYNLGKGHESSETNGTNSGAKI